MFLDCVHVCDVTLDTNHTTVNCIVCTVFKLNGSHCIVVVRRHPIKPTMKWSLF